MISLMMSPGTTLSSTNKRLKRMPKQKPWSLALCQRHQANRSALQQLIDECPGMIIFDVTSATWVDLDWINSVAHQCDLIKVNHEEIAEWTVFKAI